MGNIEPTSETLAPDPTAATSATVPPAQAVLGLSVEIARLVDATPELPPLLQEAAERIREQLACSGVGIYRLGAGQRLAPYARAGDLDTLPETETLQETDPLRLAVRKGRAILRPEPDSRDDDATTTYLFLPLSVGQEPIGVLTIGFERERTVTPETMPALQALAHHLAIVITHAERLEREQRQRQFAEKLNAVGRALSQTLDLEQILGMVLGQLAAIVPHHRSSILLEDNRELVTRAARGFPGVANPLEIRVPIHDDDVYRTICATRRPLVLGDVLERDDWQYVEGLPAARSWLGVPLVLESEVIGMLSLTRELPDPYTEEEVTLAATFANQAAMALHNADLYSNLSHVNAVLEQAIGDLQQRSEELEVTNQKLKHLDQAKSDFISIASHELRTPLTVLSGYSQMLIGDAGLKQNDYRWQLVKGIQGGTERLTTIVESMLDMARIDNRALQLNPEPMFISVLMKAIQYKMNDILTSRKIRFKIDRSIDKLPMVEADTAGIRKVFYHLVVNAVKYTPDGGKVRVWGRQLELEGVRPGRGWIEVVISDTGIGIDPSVQELIFAKFYQTGEVASHSSGISKFRGGGPGLGLAITRGIVEAHGGRVWAESPGYDEVHCPGSDFHVVLPLRPDTVLQDGDV